VALGISAIIDGLIARFKTFLGPFGKLYDKISAGISDIVHLFGRTKALVDEVRTEVDAWRNFNANPKFKNRVTNIRKAVEATKNLVVGIPAAWQALVDVVSQFKEKLTETNPTAEAEEAISDLESAGEGGITKLFPKLARSGERILGVVTLIVDAVGGISAVISDLQTIVDELKMVRTEIEDLDTLFLSQKNKRRTVTLTDGTKMKIRIGNLHS